MMNEINFSNRMKTCRCYTFGGDGNGAVGSQGMGQELANSKIGKWLKNCT